jgi:hypothetical protein
MWFTRVSCIALVIAASACSSNATSGPPVGSGLVPNSFQASPDLQLQPRKLHFKDAQSPSKTEEVRGYEPGGSYHEDCSTLGVATIGYPNTKGRKSFFLITPLHQGKCEIGFVHSVSGKDKLKTLPVTVGSSSN